MSRHRRQATKKKYKQNECRISMAFHWLNEFISIYDAKLETANALSGIEWKQIFDNTNNVYIYMSVIGMDQL